MFRFIQLLLLATTVALLCSCASPVKPETKARSDTGYDPELARELGADEYGMRPYVLVILTTGPAEITDPQHRDELFAGHFSNMAALAEQQLLVLAGPFIEGGKKRGLFVFDVATVEQARELVATDPAVAAGIFEADFTRYYGSAALRMVNDLHKRIQKTGIQ